MRCDLNKGSIPYIIIVIMIQRIIIENLTIKNSFLSIYKRILIYNSPIISVVLIIRLPQYFE